MTKRTQNVLVSVDSSSPVKRKLSLDDLLQSFILDCKANNLSSLTLKDYEDGVQRMKEAFQAQQIPLDIYTVTSRDIKNYFIAYMIDQGKSDNTVNSRIKGIKQFFKYLFRRLDHAKYCGRATCCKSRKTDDSNFHQRTSG